MDEQQVKELGEEIREILPENTIHFKISADEVEISYKDHDEAKSEITTELPYPDRFYVDINEGNDNGTIIADTQFEI